MAGAEEVGDKRLADVYYLNNIIQSSFSHTNIYQIVSKCFEQSNYILCSE